MSALPPRPTSPARHAIGLPILPRGSLAPRDGLHSTSPSVASPVVPNRATGRIAGIGVERMPHSTANVVSPAARQGAISGTGLAPRHLGPPQIGRANAVTGINGTTIKRRSTQRSANTHRRLLVEANRLLERIALEPQD